MKETIILLILNIW